jgi:uncharacterized membrane protein
MKVTQQDRDTAQGIFMVFIVVIGIIGISILASYYPLIVASILLAVLISFFIYITYVAFFAKIKE